MERRGGSPREVSALYGIPYHHVKLACRTGLLVPRKFGRRSVLTFTSVEAWIDSQPPTKSSRPKHRSNDHVLPR
jgi:hypothetical protein